MTNPPPLRLSIAPEASDDEIAAITAILLARRRARQPAASSVTVNQPSRWAMAGRLEAMRGVQRDQLTRIVSTGRSE